MVRLVIEGFVALCVFAFIGFLGYISGLLYVYMFAGVAACILLAALAAEAIYYD